MGQYISSPGHRAYCYAELAVSSLAVPRPSPVLIAPTHGWMARLRQKRVYNFELWSDQTKSLTRWPVTRGSISALQAYSLPFPTPWCLRRLVLDMTYNVFGGTLNPTLNPTLLRLVLGAIGKSRVGFELKPVRGTTSPRGGLLLSKWCILVHSQWQMGLQWRGHIPRPLCQPLCWRLQRYSLSLQCKSWLCLYRSFGCFVSALACVCVC